jgi:hypothetical protein
VRGIVPAARDNDPLCEVLSRLPGDNDPLCGVLSPLFPWTHFCHFFDTARPVCPPSSSPPSPSSPHCLPLPLLCPRPPRPRSHTTSRPLIISLSHVRPHVLPADRYTILSLPPRCPPTSVSHLPPSLTSVSYPTSRPAPPPSPSPHSTRNPIPSPLLTVQHLIQRKLSTHDRLACL